jgi:hypothetical protein
MDTVVLARSALYNGETHPRRRMIKTGMLVYLQRLQFELLKNLYVLNDGAPQWSV